MQIDAVVQDLRFALRGFRRSPGFAACAILTIALAVGAATAVFSVVDRSLFRPLPYSYGGRLVSIGIVAPVIATQDWMFAGTFQEWQRSQPAFEAMAAWKGVSDCDRSDGTPERLGCSLVDSNFLPTLGVLPLIGRNFSVEEDQAGAEAVALVSYGFWRSRFGGDAGALGKSVVVDGVPTRIVGVLPADFETPTLASAEVLLPLKLRRGSQKQRVVHVIGRVREGLSIGGARAQLAPAFENFVQAAPADFKGAVPMRLRVETLRDGQIRDYRLALWMLLGAVLSFVLIACANVAHLLLAKSATRKHEFSVRAALGASKWRLARQTLTETAVLGLAGGGLGFVLAGGLLEVFQTLAPEGVLRMREATLDFRVLASAAMLSVLSALVFGIAPAIERLRGEALASARVVGRGRNWLRPGLVSLQLAISVMLLRGLASF